MRSLSLSRSRRLPLTLFDATLVERDTSLLLFNFTGQKGGEGLPLKVYQDPREGLCGTKSGIVEFDMAINGWVRVEAG